jgi:lysophospholipase
MLSLGVKTFNGECLPGPNATTYEFSPYKFGSWDSDVSAFTLTQYLGISLYSRQPTTPDSCIVNYDNLGYILGSSSTIFNEVCLPVSPVSNSTTDLLSEMIVQVHSLSTRDEYAVYPNPFYEYSSSTGIPNLSNALWTQQELHLADGGESLQGNPIWPFLQPARAVDVMIVNDNNADTSNLFPNGSEILTTYVQSLNANLTGMPYIPSMDTFLFEGLNKRATFFGCNATDKITIVYLPKCEFHLPEQHVHIQAAVFGH